MSKSLALTITWILLIIMMASIKVWSFISAKLAYDIEDANLLTTTLANLQHTHFHDADNSTNDDNLKHQNGIFLVGRTVVGLQLSSVVLGSLYKTYKRLQQVFL